MPEDVDTSLQIESTIHISIAQLALRSQFPRRRQYDFTCSLSYLARGCNSLANDHLRNLRNLDIIQNFLDGLLDSDLLQWTLLYVR